MRQRTWICLAGVAAAHHTASSPPHTLSHSHTHTHTHTRMHRHPHGRGSCKECLGKRGQHRAESLRGPPAPNPAPPELSRSLVDLGVFILAPYRAMGE